MVVKGMVNIQSFLVQLTGAILQDHRAARRLFFLFNLWSGINSLSRPKINKALHLNALQKIYEMRDMLINDTTKWDF